MTHELHRIAIGEGFYWNGVHYNRTDESFDADSISIRGAHGVEYIDSETLVKPDMKPFTTKAA